MLPARCTGILRADALTPAAAKICGSVERLRADMRRVALLWHDPTRAAEVQKAHVDMAMSANGGE